MILIFNANENCWDTGIFTDECDCEVCIHKDECSGGNENDDGR